MGTPFFSSELAVQKSRFLRYQGESNVAANPGWGYQPGMNCGIGLKASGAASPEECAQFYQCQFPAMIADWRSKWNQGNASTPRPKPFLFVQLAPYTEGVGMPYDISTALIREAQTSALSLPHVGMSSAIDYGDTGSPAGNIHPRHKEPVGTRLANVVSIGDLTHPRVSHVKGWPKVLTHPSRDPLSGLGPANGVREK